MFWQLAHIDQLLPNLSVHHAHASPRTPHPPTNVASGPLQVGQRTLGAGCCSGHHHGGQLKDGDQEDSDYVEGENTDCIIGMTMISMTMYRTGMTVMVATLWCLWWWSCWQGWRSRICLLWNESDDNDWSYNDDGLNGEDLGKRRWLSCSLWNQPCWPKGLERKKLKLLTCQVMKALKW